MKQTLMLVTAQQNGALATSPIDPWSSQRNVGWGVIMGCEVTIQKLWSDKKSDKFSAKS